MHRHELVGQQGEGREEDDGVFHAVGEDIAVAVHVEVPQQDGSGRDEQHKQETAQVRGVGKVLHVAAAAVEELEQQRLHGQEEHQEQGRPFGKLAQDERSRGLLVQLFGRVEARHPVVCIGRDAARHRVDGQVEVEALFLVGCAQTGGAAQDADLGLCFLVDGGARQARVEEQAGQGDEVQLVAAILIVQADEAVGMLGSMGVEHLEQRLCVVGIDCRVRQGDGVVAQQGVHHRVRYLFAGYGQQCTVCGAFGGHEEQGEENDGDAHVQPEGVHVGVDLAVVELVRQEARAGEHQAQCHPYLAVELVHVLKILADVFPHGLVDVEGILAALVAVHTLQAGAAVHAVGVAGAGVAADASQAHGLDVPSDTSASLSEYFYEFHRLFFILRSSFFIYIASASVASSHSSSTAASRVAMTVNTT